MSIRLFSGLLARVLAFSSLVVTALAQPGAVPVAIQGQILDLTHVPALAPASLAESYDAATRSGPQVVFDLDNGNVVLFTTAGQSQFFTTYPVPGEAGDAGSVHYPPNAFYFYSSMNKTSADSGFLAGSMFYNSGMLSIKDGPAATQNILYSASWDNPLWWDRSDPALPADTVAPLYYWADLVPGDPEACNAMPAGRIPKGRFVILTRRFGCDFLKRASNIAASGAAAWIIYDNVETDNNGGLTTLGASLPVVRIRNVDGMALIDQIRNSSSQPVVVMHPHNLQGFLTGTYQLAPDGSLRSVNFNLQITNAFDSIFAGTVATPLN